MEELLNMMNSMNVSSYNFFDNNDNYIENAMNESFLERFFNPENLMIERETIQNIQNSHHTYSFATVSPDNFDETDETEEVYYNLDSDSESESETYNSDLEM